MLIYSWSFAELISKIDVYCNNYQKSNKKNMAELYPDATIKELRQDLQSCIEYADEKVAVAVQTYELVRKQSPKRVKRVLICHKWTISLFLRHRAFLNIICIIF